MRTCNLNARHEFDEIVDVRTPAEFSDDHIPGATNAPVLSNEERAEVGTIYKQDCEFKATRHGAGLVARNIARHLETTFADRPPSWRPLIYCWRGGKRSAAMTEWFNLIGWGAVRLEGGYKSWRHHVLASLETTPAAFDYLVIAGPTGSGKTRLLEELARAGAQVIDLEGLARHRGSLLGGLPNGEPQPSQRYFETRLFDAFESFDPRRPVFVEAESRRIGALSLPAALMEAMHQSPCVYVSAPMAERVSFLLQDYHHLFEEPESFKQKLRPLIGPHSRQTVEEWLALIDEGADAELFARLVTDHYDPAYRRSSNKHFVRIGEAHPFSYHPTRDDDGAQARQLLTELGLA